MSCLANSRPLLQAQVEAPDLIAMSLNPSLITPLELSLADSVGSERGLVLNEKGARAERPTAKPLAKACSRDGARAARNWLVRLPIGCPRGAPAV
jgi:hypothetical protein